MRDLVTTPQVARDLITTSQVAREFSIAESTVRKMADDGRLPVAATLDDGTRLFERRLIEERKAATSK
jgi:hypothetical protein